MRINLSTISLKMLPLEAALDRAVDGGYEAIELGAVGVFCPHFAAVPGDVEARRRIAGAVAERSLTVSAVNAVPFILVADADDAAAIRATTDEVLRMARDLDAAVVLSAGRRGSDPLDARRRAADELRAAHVRGRDYFGVDVSVEAPHTGMSAITVAETVELLDMIGIDSMGIAYDASHIVAGGSNARDSLDLLGHRIRHVHARDARGGDIHHLPGDGDYDWATLVAHLEATGHTRGMTLELEFTGDVTPDEVMAGAERARAHLLGLVPA